MLILGLTQVLLFSALVALVACTSEPLLLTPLVKAGKIAEAQELARVVPDMNGEKSFSGFFTVNEDCGNNLFFWFFPARNDWEQAPVLLWMQGGPGKSSLYGMFTQIGPFNYSKKAQFKSNDYTWTNDNNVIFLDQPVGTGFSFTEKECYRDNMTAVADDVHEFLQQFFALFPNLQDNRFFLTGESFAGHYIPAVASCIHNKKDQASIKINMIGFVLGNPSVDTRCEKFADKMYEMGIIDQNVKERMETIEENIVKAIDDQNYTLAYEQDWGERQNIVTETQLPYIYNFEYDECSTYDFDLLVRYYKTRQQIHVGMRPYGARNYSADPTFNHLKDSMFISTVSYLEEMIKTKKYLVGVYSGLLDLRFSYTSTECVLRELQWDGAEEYLAANRSAWYVGARLAGWFKVAGNLFEVAVRGAGNEVPTDQGQAALALITAVTKSNPGETPLSTLKPTW